MSPRFCEPSVPLYSAVVRVQYSREGVSRLDCCQEKTWRLRVLSAGALQGSARGVPSTWVTLGVGSSKTRRHFDGGYYVVLADF